ncbi:hypothetical protein B0H11DRAFT_2239808 [Mycena galericulata]|nr:hypothetical protein B0H11DRAFT_2239808 [Mycena galericulata]
MLAAISGSFSPPLYLLLPSSSIRLMFSHGYAAKPVYARSAYRQRTLYQDPVTFSGSKQETTVDYLFEIREPRYDPPRLSENLRNLNWGAHWKPYANAPFFHSSFPHSNSSESSTSGLYLDGGDGEDDDSDSRVVGGASTEIKIAKSDNNARFKSKNTNKKKKERVDPCSHWYPGTAMNGIGKVAGKQGLGGKGGHRGFVELRSYGQMSCGGIAVLRPRVFPFFHLLTALASFAIGRQSCVLLYSVFIDAY